MTGTNARIELTDDEVEDVNEYTPHPVAITYDRGAVMGASPPHPLLICVTERDGTLSLSLAQAGSTTWDEATWDAWDEEATQLEYILDKHNEGHCVLSEDQIEAVDAEIEAYDGFDHVETYQVDEVDERYGGAVDMVASALD